MHLLEQPVLEDRRQLMPVKYASWDWILFHHAVSLKDVGPVLSWLDVSIIHWDQCHYMHLGEQELVCLYAIWEHLQKTVTAYESSQLSSVD